MASELQAELTSAEIRRKEIFESHIWAYANASSCDGGLGYDPYREVRAEEAELTATIEAIPKEISILFET